jgi:pyruvate dehydrogenase E1 component alpha subunit
MLAELYGKASGCSSGKGGSMHLVDPSVNMLGSTPIVGSSLPVAVGTAFGSWLKGEERVSIVFFGEGSTEEGVFSECVNFAALKRLPVIFICENNLYSVYSPLSVRQAPERNRVALAQAHGITSRKADGNEVETVYGLARESVRDARTGKGPMYLEFETYRWREHCGPHYDNHLGYRTEEEFLAWQKRCPIENFKTRLLREGVVSGLDIEREMAGIQKEIREAFEFAKMAPWPSEKNLLSDIYAEGDQR